MRIIPAFLLSRLSPSAVARPSSTAQPKIAVGISPANGTCSAFRNSEPAGSYDASRHVACSAPGYKPQSQTLISTLDPVGALSPTWDYATGALNEYPASIIVVLDKS